MGFVSARRRWVIGLSAVAAAGLLALGWFAFSVRTTLTELSASRTDLLSARQSLGGSDIDAARTSLVAAAQHARTGADEARGPLWDAAAALPGLGATPAAVREIALSLDEALASLTPAVDAIGGLRPSALIRPGGRVDLAAMQRATPALQSALAGVSRASGQAAVASTRSRGALVPAPVEQAADQLSGQLAGLRSTLTQAVAICRIAPPLLGADEAKRYFVGILNPNEARGIGGFLGAYVIVQADHGRLKVSQVGSNSALPDFSELPVDLGEQYFDRYGDDPALKGNMNISPDFPAAARLWLASWKKKTGETLDGAFAADVVALGRLVSATGNSVPLPDGGSLTGDRLTQFAISGVYQKYPHQSQSPARKAYQEALTAAAVKVITASPSRQSLATAAGEAMSEHRILLWSAAKTTEKAILATPAGGSLRVPDGHFVNFVAINGSGSKLDAWLRRSVSYEVGRCSAQGRVESRVTVRLTNAIPKGATIPEYMISLAEIGAKGPINSTLAQVHLPNGSEILEVFVDGKSVGYSTFLEQDRMSLVIQMQLSPREERSLSVSFTEPDSAGPGSAPAQPLGTEAETAITDRGCQS